MKSQCKTCTIAESECEYKKAPNHFFDGVDNVCTRDPRQKAQKAAKSLEQWQKEFEDAYNHPHLNMSEEDRRKEWPNNIKITKPDYSEMDGYGLCSTCRNCYIEYFDGRECGTCRVCDNGNEDNWRPTKQCDNQ